MGIVQECSICNGSADLTFKRIEVWKNDTWRLTMSTFSEVRGFCYLEPIKHIEYITDLDGKEADEFGKILSFASKAIKKATGAKLVYVYIFGDHVPHLHVHLAPHFDGDNYVDDVIKSEINIREDVMRDEEQFKLRSKTKSELLQLYASSIL
jgi:diadenosine tetraphosphate (Ap4A) HIT family hydrolase